MAANSHLMFSCLSDLFNRGNHCFFFLVPGFTGPAAGDKLTLTTSASLLNCHQGLFRN